MALAEKGLPFEVRNLNLQRFEQYRPEYLVLNPLGQVPTLLHEGRVICDSAVICDYLEERFPQPPLRPLRSEAVGLMRRWVSFVEDVGKPAIFPPTWSRLLGDLRAAAAEPEILALLGNVPSEERRKRWERIIWDGFSQAELERSRIGMQQVLSAFEEGLQGADWLAQDCFSLADIAAYPVVERIFELQHDGTAISGCERLHAWYGRMKQRPALIGAV